MTCDLSYTVYSSPPSAPLSCDGWLSTSMVQTSYLPVTYLWSTGSTQPYILNLCSGVYTVTVTDAVGCSVDTTISIGNIILGCTDSIAINYNPLATIDDGSCIYCSSLSVIINTMSNVSCNGMCDGSATANPTGGIPPYSYLWTGGQTTQTAVGLCAGTYTCTITDANGCPITSVPIVVSQPTSALTITSTSSTDVSCNGGNDGMVTLTLSGGTPGYTYSWSGGQTSNPAINLTAGTYSCTITDANNCPPITTGPIVVSQPATGLTITSASSTDVSCNGGNDGTATVNVSGGTPGYTYSWSPGGLTTNPATGLTAGIYYCTVTDANGCTEIVFVTINEPPAITITSNITNVSCNGGNDGAATLTLSGGTGTLTADWGAVNPNALPEGTFGFTITDANNCSFTDSVTITEPAVALRASSSTTNVSCNGGNDGIATIYAAGGTPGYTYLWSNGLTSNTATGLTAGTYICTVVDANGCTATDSVVITEPTAITASFSYSNISVNGANDGTISVSASGGVPGYMYYWTGPNGYTNTGPNINSLPAGVYFVTITDANGCLQFFPQTITQPNCNVYISGTYTAPVCYGDSAELDWLNSGGLPPYTNTLTNSFGFTIATVNGALFSSPSIPILLPAGVWDLVVTDAAGCPAILNIPVTTPDSITVTISTTDATCYGYNDGTASDNVSGGTAPYNIDWGLVNPNQLIAGNYNILVTDNNGCVSGPTNYTIGRPAQLVVDSLITTVGKGFTVTIKSAELLGQGNAAGTV